MYNEYKIVQDWRQAMNLKDRRVIKTKTNIKRVFMELLSNRPFEKITVTEIAEIALISKTTFYLHYDSKYDLAEECIEDFIAEIQEGIQNSSLNRMGGYLDSIIERINVLNKISINNFYLYDKIRATIAGEVQKILLERGVEKEKLEIMSYQIASIIIDFIRYKSMIDGTVSQSAYMDRLLELISVYKICEKSESV